MKAVKVGSKFLYCRNCQFKTAHSKTLKSDWGYSCNICQTWQHECVLAEIQQGCFAVCFLTPSFVGRCPPPPQGERSSPQGYPSFSIMATWVKGFASGGNKVASLLYLGTPQTPIRRP